jgi:hypothetical protein
MEKAADFNLSQGVYVAARKDGPRVTLEFRIGTQQVGPILLSTAQAIEAAGDVRKDKSSSLIPIVRFEDNDAINFAKWLMEFLA